MALRIDRLEQGICRLGQANSRFKRGNVCVDLIDMRSTADAIIGCVRVRLSRITRLIEILP